MKTLLVILGLWCHPCGPDCEPPEPEPVTCESQYQECRDERGRAKSCEVERKDCVKSRNGWKPSPEWLARRS